MTQSWAILFVAILPTAAAAQVGAAPTQADFQAYASRLARSNSKSVRLDAVKWFNSHSRAKGAEAAIPALSKCIREDDDWDVRSKAVESLALIALDRKMPCPVVVVEAMLDADELVRAHANTYAGLFPQYAPGSIEVLLRCARSENRYVRADSLFHLARAGGKDKKILAVIESAQRDPTFWVRHSAHCALFTANDNLLEFLRYILRLSDDPQAGADPAKKDTEEGKRERETRNLSALGGSMRLIEWSEKRPDELANALLKLLDDPSPVLRRGSAKAIGMTVAKFETTKWSPYLLLPKEEKPAKKPPQKSNVAIVLAKLNAERRLRALRDDDKEASVREAARVALERWAKLDSSTKSTKDTNGKN